MGEGDGPGRVSQPVDATPGAGPQACPQQTGDEDGDHEIKRHGAQPTQKRLYGDVNGTTTANHPILT